MTGYRAVAVLTVAALVVSVLAVGQPWRAAVILAFLALVPGIAFAHRIPVRDRRIRWVLIVAGDLALATCCSEMLALVHIWSAAAVLCALAAVGLAGPAVLERVRPGTGGPR